MSRAEDREDHDLIAWITEERDYYLEKARSERDQHGGWWYRRDIATARFFNRMLLMTRRGITRPRGDGSDE